MAKETLLNWTKFEKALDTMVEGEEPTSDQRDVLEFYQLVKANVGTTVGTIEFEDNPMVYVSLNELNEDIGSEGSGITHSDAVHEQLKKHGLLELKRVDDEDYVQPSKELVFNLGKLEKAVEEAESENSFSEFYNHLSAVLSKKQIPIHAADLNGNSKIVRVTDIYEAGFDIPLLFFLEYVEKHEIPVSKEEEEEPALEDQILPLTRQLILLGRRYRRLEETISGKDTEPTAPKNATLDAYTIYLARLFAYRAEQEALISYHCVTLAEKVAERVQETEEIKKVHHDREGPMPIGTIERGLHISENTILRDALQPWQVSEGTVDPIAALYVSLLGQLSYMDFLTAQRIASVLNIDEKAIETLLKTAKIPPEEKKYDMQMVREKILNPAFTKALDYLGLQERNRQVQETQWQRPASKGQEELRKRASATPEEIEQQHRELYHEYERKAKPYIDAAQQILDKDVHVIGRLR